MTEARTPERCEAQSLGATLEGLVVLVAVLALALVPLMVMIGDPSERAPAEPAGLSYEAALAQAQAVARASAGADRFAEGAVGREAELSLHPFVTGAVMLRRCWQPPLSQAALAACLAQEQEAYGAIAADWTRLEIWRRLDVLTRCDATALSLADLAACVAEPAQLD